MKPLSYQQATKAIRDACAASNATVSAADIMAEMALPRTPNDMQIMTILHRLSDHGVVCVPTWCPHDLVIYPPTGLHLLTWYINRDTKDVPPKIMMVLREVLRFAVFNAFFDLVSEISRA